MCAWLCINDVIDCMHASVKTVYMPVMLMSSCAQQLAMLFVTFNTYAMVKMYLN